MAPAVAAKPGRLRSRSRPRAGPGGSRDRDDDGSGGGGGGGGGGVSGRTDPFPGPAPLPRPRVKRFLRGTKEPAGGARAPGLRWRLKGEGQREEGAAARAARHQLLLPLQPGFLEPDPGEAAASISQAAIAEAVDISSATKHFELRLDQFGPYRLDYDRTGRHLLLGGSRGHVAALDWPQKKLLCEFNVMEPLTDLAWLHSESLVAVAQRRWLHIYDNQGLELNCLKSFSGVLRLQFLPFHFLLATANSRGYLQYLDISVGKEVASLCTRRGRLGVMTQNPTNAIVHLGHSNGTVTLWSPKVPEPLVRFLGHRGALRALAVHPGGTLLASSGLDQRLRLWDLRMLKVLQELPLPRGAAELHFSQRGLLGAACGDLLQVFQGVGEGQPPQLYLCHRPPHPPQSLRFCPFEDVLGAGHGGGFTSILVPGAGEPNVDGLEPNPLRGKRQRQEWEVKALLEKIPAELLTPDPGDLGRLDVATLGQRREERIQRLGFDPQAKAKFRPRRRAKGDDPARRRRQVQHERQRAEIKQSLEQRQQQRQEKGGDKEGPPKKKRGALERFKK